MGESKEPETVAVDNDDQTSALLHVLLSKVNKHTTNGTLSGFGLADTPIRVDVIVGEIGRGITVREADRSGQGGVTHVLGTTGHGWKAVRIWVSEFK